MHSRPKIRQKWMFQVHIQATLIQQNKHTVYGKEYHPSEYHKHLDKHNFTGFSSCINILYYCAVITSSNMVLIGQICELQIWKKPAVTVM
jgi:hypothetical protein